MRKFSVTIICILAYVCTLSAAQKKIQVNIDYINRYSQIAIEKMREHRIPASITLAQGILESGAGLSELAKKSNNHFGIKCHDDWTGERVYHDDDQKQECFRKYSKPEQSYEDHSQFLKKKRYESLFALQVTDYKGWAKGLKACGYATAKDYADRLIELIETYNLQQYDQIALGNMPNDVIAPSEGGNGTNNYENLAQEKKYLKESAMGSIPVDGNHRVSTEGRKKSVVARRGDSYESIADEFGLRKWQIRRYNKVRRGDNSQPATGDVVYISK